jgi:hypothetical protein
VECYYDRQTTTTTKGDHYRQLYHQQNVVLKKPKDDTVERTIAVVHHSRHLRPRPRRKSQHVSTTVATVKDTGLSAGYRNWSRTGPQPKHARTAPNPRMLRIHIHPTLVVRVLLTPGPGMPPAHLWYLVIVSHAGLAVLSAFGAGVLVPARYQVTRRL